VPPGIGGSVAAAGWISPGRVELVLAGTVVVVARSATPFALPRSADAEWSESERRSANATPAMTRTPTSAPTVTQIQGRASFFSGLGLLERGEERCEIVLIVRLPAGSRS
jgi:hypothetical protein